MKKIFNFVFYSIIFILIALKMPTWWNNFKMQNNVAPQVLLKRLSGENIEFPVLGKKQIIIFWATWCGPCKVELQKLNLMMANGIIKNDQLLAVNIQEDAKTINDFLNNNPLQFIIALDESGEVSKKYNVSGTPTIVFLDEKAKVNWISTGISPTLEYRIKNFLKN